MRSRYKTDGYGYYAVIHPRTPAINWLLRFIVMFHRGEKQKVEIGYRLDS